jgi:hypothetical protein
MGKVKLVDTNVFGGTLLMLVNGVACYMLMRLP